ncbi:MAG TPA: hypothetical protein VK826_10170 [Bacteroidia bacterium]|nr:hypothetical protein [Bacteroidia bacterium]
MKQLQIPAIILFVLIAIASCKKERRAGESNHASVISSNTIVLNNWLALYNDGTEFSYSSTIAWSSITQEIRDSGLLIIYVHDSASSDWYALPHCYVGDEYSRAFDFDFNTGVVNVTCRGHDIAGSPGGDALNGSLTVRLVAVPAAVRVANPDIDWTNYESVRKTFGLAK